MKEKILQFLNQETNISSRDVFDLGLLLIGGGLFLIVWGEIRDAGLVYYFLRRFFLFIELIEGTWLQNLRFFPLIGVEIFFIYFLFPLSYWLGKDYLTGKAIAGLLFGAGITFFMRRFMALPGPSFPEDRIIYSGYSFPSGHMVQSIMVFGILVESYKNKLTKTFFILLITIMGISRIMTGAHFLDDVIAGIIVGAVLLFLFQKIIAYLESNELLDYLSLTFVALLIVTPFTVYFFTGDQARHSVLLVYFIGFFSGYFLQNKYFNLEKEKISLRLLRAFFGFYVVFSWLASKVIIKDFVGDSRVFFVRSVSVLFLSLFVTLWPIIFNWMYSKINLLINRKNELVEK